MAKRIQGEKPRGGKGKINDLMGPDLIQTVKLPDNNIICQKAFFNIAMYQTTSKLCGPGK